MAVDRPDKYAKYDDDQVFNKLVRDKIPEVLDSVGLKCTYEIMNNDETLLRLLIEKVVEEANEAFDAVDGDRNELIEELGDLLEVVEHLEYHFPHLLKQARRVQTQKRLTHGGFSKRIFLVKTEPLEAKEY